jgi:chromosomal replication initiation ATPase DnaA
MGITVKESEKVSLTDLILPNERTSFAGVAPLPSNVRAVEIALLFATGHTTFGVIHGASGCGKTQILRAAASYCISHSDRTVEYRTAEQFISQSSRNEPSIPVVLDDCQSVIGKPKQRLLFRLAIERRVRANRPTLLCFSENGLARPLTSKQLTSFLPHSRSWKVEKVESPSTPERFMLIQHLARTEGMRLSPALINIIATKMLGNGRVLLGAIRRLKLQQTDWVEPLQVLRACGTLDPYFADNPTWDLRHRIARVAEDHQTMFPEVNATDMAIFTMLRTAGLCEGAVSSYLGISPTTAYTQANAFARLTRGDAMIAARHHQFVELTLDRLLTSP